MNAPHRNLIAGEWVDGAAVTRNINPSDTNDVDRRVRASRRRSDRRGDRSRAHRFSRLGARDAPGAP